MHIFVTGGTGHAGSHIIPELIAAGHDVTGLARSDASAAALSALGAKVRRGSLEDLDGLKEAAADSDGVIHVAHRQDLLPTGGMDAVAAAELPIMLAYGEALAGTGKPLVAAGSIGSPGNLGRPATEEDPALPSGEEHKGTLRARNVVERAVIGLAEQGVRSSIVRLPLIAHDTTDNAGFLPGLIALAKEKGFAGYPGDGTNLWCAVHIRDVASLFRLALEKGPAGRYWHAVQDEGIPFREIAEAIGSRLDLPAVSVPMDVLMLPGYFGQFTNLVTRILPGDQPHHPPDPGLGTRCSPNCSPIWTTATTSRPTDGRGTPTKSHALNHTHYERSNHDHVRPAPRHLGVLRRLHPRRRRQRHPHRLARRGRAVVRPVRR